MGRTTTNTRRVWTAGPYQIEILPEEGSGGYAVHLSDGERSETIATGIPTVEDAREVVRDFTDMVKPADVSFYSSDATVPEAAASAKRAVEFDRKEGQGGITDFGG